MKTKAAEARRLIKPLIHLLERKGGAGEIDKHLLAAYKHTNNMYSTVMEMPMVPSDATADYILREYDMFLLHYNPIATKCMQDVSLILI